MFYINDPAKPVKTYKEVVEAAVKSGIMPQRAYIYLGSRGIRGAKARFLLQEDYTPENYGPVTKIAVNDDGNKVTSVEVCDHCGNLVIQ